LRRLKIADDCLDDMIEWLQNGSGQVGIYDGNNITEERRKEVNDRLLEKDIHVRLCQYGGKYILNR
jgi:6-phosphofructo-2-kinase/fructose-2,6-biphosphatase 4